MTNSDVSNKSSLKVRTERISSEAEKIISQVDRRVDIVNEVSVLPHMAL